MEARRAGLAAAPKRIWSTLAKAIVERHFVIGHQPNVGRPGSGSSRPWQGSASSATEVCVGQSAHSRFDTLADTFKGSTACASTIANPGPRAAANRRPFAPSYDRVVDRYDAFRFAFRPTGIKVPSQPCDRNADLIGQVEGLSALMAEMSGRVLNDGVYRLFDQALADAADGFVAHAFPAWYGRLAPFGCDWMGRIYAVDGSDRRTADGELCPSLLDPATRDLLRVPASVTDFHNTILVDDLETAAEKTLWEAWRGTAHRDLGYGEVVGWNKPGYLGGSLVLSNLEVQPAGVYWELSGQLIAQTFKLKPGTQIKSVSIE